MTDLRFRLASSTRLQVADSDNTRLQHYHALWRKQYLRPSRQVPGGAYVDYQEQQTTCSEAHGYGMLASVYYAAFQPDQARQDFDALNGYRKHYPSGLDARLMTWYVDDKLPGAQRTTCATDGDLDMAYALLLAAYRWQHPAYLAEAWQILAGIEHSLIREDFSLRRGEWDVNQHAVRLSDIMPVHFTAFARVSDAVLWGKVSQVQYGILQQTLSPQGVFPDFVLLGKRGWEAVPPDYLESAYDGMMYYNACRVPWRLAAAAIENHDQTAFALLQRFNQGIGKVGNADFRAGYDLHGQCLNDWTDGAFTAPHLCSLLVNGRREDFQTAKQAQFACQEGYFQDSIRLLSLYLVTGNTFTLKDWQD